MIPLGAIQPLPRIPSMEPSKLIPFRHEVTTRTLRFDESLPDSLSADLVGVIVDPQWCWVVDVMGVGKVAALLVAPAHGLAIFIRLCVLPEAPRWVLGRLFRKVLDDLSERGYHGYAALLDPSRSEELKLLRIVARAGGSVHGSGVVVAGMCDYKGMKLQTQGMER